MTAGGAARVAVRMVGFITLVLYAVWRYWREVGGVPKQGQRRARALWLHKVCRRHLRLLGVRVTVRGPRPDRGLIVANHLGYLDICVLSVAVPCVFISKKEIAEWPVFGALAQWSGTLFLDRERRGAVGGVAAQMREVLEAGLPLAFFPEGTSTHGDTVLPFKTSLFAPAAELNCPVTAAALRYGLPDGSVRDEIHWWGDMTFSPHMLNLLSKPLIESEVVFGESRLRHGDRKAIAQDLHAEIVNLLKAR